MSEAIDNLTVNYEEDGVLMVKETGKEILSKGAWTTILFRYLNWDKKNQVYGKEAFAIRRYQKRGEEYILKSKFTISSQEQARKIIDTLEGWMGEKK
jgi:hypothetical protein